VPCTPPASTRAPSSTPVRSARGDRRARALRAARCRLALGHGRARGGGAECAVEESFVSERANLLDIYDLWLIAVSAAMVKNTRFDPLLSLAVEQRLFAALPQIAARAATEGKVEAALEENGSRFAVEVEAQLFADAAQPF
jgi:hypothetical protein